MQPIHPMAGAAVTPALERRFVGRERELAELEQLLSSTSSTSGGLYVHGPGGIGKTWLVRELAELAQARGRRPLLLDGRAFEPTREAFLEALTQALPPGANGSPLEALAAQQPPAVVLVDTAELLTSLEGWIRDELLPRLPPGAVLVLASREPPSPAWRSSAGWRRTMRPLALRGLSSDESRSLLELRAVPSSRHEAVLRFAWGHPLALALAADIVHQHGDREFSPDTAPDLIRVLVERFVERVPDGAHRAAVDASALLRATTEPALAATLGGDAHALFDWLRGLSFIESGPDGVHPHDLAREALLADLRWRNPERFVDLHQRASAFYVERLRSAGGRAQDRALLDYVYLQSHHPALRPFFAWSEDKEASFDHATSADVPDIVALVRLHEGHESAALAERWLGRDLDSVMVARDEHGALAGALVPVALETASAEERDADAGTRAAWSWLERNEPLRPGERATFFRFWAARDGYQRVSGVSSMLRILMARYILSTPRLAFAFRVHADPDYFEHLLPVLGTPLAEGATFEIGGRRHAIAALNLRKVPPTAWMHQIGQRAAAALSVAGTSPAPTAETLLVLDRTAFVEAVRDGLKHLNDPTSLAQNPLIRSRLVVGRAGAGTRPKERAAALGALLREAIEPLAATPQGAKLHRALDRTYLHPAPTQERAAESLALPFSTYRRHLVAGIERVVEALWTRDIGGADD